MKQRIQKLLGNAGIDSRRNIEEMVRNGRVAVNGTVVRELPILVDPAVDRVMVDGEELDLRPAGQEKRYYFLMHKPKGVVSTNVAQGEQTRAIDLLPPGLEVRMYPVGRLDAESKGLLLLTNDGELTNKLTHPRYGVPKTYRATVDGYIEQETIDQLQKGGIWLADKAGKAFKTAKSRIEISHREREKSVLEITLREGRNRQVRRMLAKVGHKVRELTRIRMGPLTLEKLDVGQVRQLTPKEVKQLQRAVDPERREEKREKRKGAKGAKGAKGEGESGTTERPAKKPRPERVKRREGAGGKGGGGKAARPDRPDRPGKGKKRAGGDRPAGGRGGKNARGGKGGARRDGQRKRPRQGGEGGQ